jgi:GNAT superfamily N-acetyltransferase
MLNSTSCDIEYRHTRVVPREKVLALYRAVGWSSAEKPEQLMAALAGSDTVVTAWDGDQLVGLGNAITDSALVVYYPHLVVHPRYQRHGIGRQIMRRLTKRYTGFHQHAVLADAGAADFYAKCGFARPVGIQAMWIYAGTDHDLPGNATDGYAAYDVAHAIGTSRRQRWAIILWAAQVLAAIAAPLAGLVDIESILVTGPLLSVVGLALAMVARPARSWNVLLYALSAPAVIFGCFQAIVAFRWGPTMATLPLMVVLILYLVLTVPLAVRSLVALRRWESPPRPRWRFRGQFSLRTMLIVMTVACVAMAIVSILFSHARIDDDSIFVVFQTFLLLAMGAVSTLYVVDHVRAGRASIGRPARESNRRR